MARLAGRRIIITGGASGIGRATARLFRREGAAVAILDRSDNAAKVVADEIGAVAIACDVSDPASVSAAVNKAAEAMGGLDGVVNAAGILAETGIADTTAEMFSRTVAVNLTVWPATGAAGDDVTVVAVPALSTVSVSGADLLAPRVAVPP